MYKNIIGILVLFAMVSFTTSCNERMDKDDLLKIIKKDGKGDKNREGDKDGKGDKKGKGDKNREGDKDGKGDKEGEGDKNGKGRKKNTP